MPMVQAPTPKRDATRAALVRILGNWQRMEREVGLAVQQLIQMTRRQGVTQEQADTEQWLLNRIKKLLQTGRQLVQQRVSVTGDLPGRTAE